MLNQINTNVWEYYEIYDSYHEAFCMIGFVKNQGYAGVKIIDLKDGQYAIATLSTRGMKANG